MLMMTHNNNINIVIEIKNHQQDYHQEDMINQNLMILDMIIKLIMFIQEIMKNHFNQILIIKIIIKQKRNHPLDYLQEDMINQNPMIQDMIIKLIMFIQEIMKNHFNQILIIKVQHLNPSIKILKLKINNIEDKMNKQFMKNKQMLEDMLDNKAILINQIKNLVNKIQNLYFMMMKMVVHKGKKKILH